MGLQRQLIVVGSRSGWLAQIARRDAGGFGRELELRGMHGQVLLAATEQQQRWQVQALRERSAVLVVDGERSLDSARNLAGDPAEGPPLVVVARTPAEAGRLERFLASRDPGNDHRYVVVEWSDDALEFRNRLLRGTSAVWAAHIAATGRNVIVVIDDDNARFVEGGDWYRRLVELHHTPGVFSLPCTLRAEDQLDRLRRQVEPVVELLRALATPGRLGYRAILVYVDNVLAVSRGHGVDLGRRLALLLKALVPRTLVLTASSQEVTWRVDGFFDLEPERIKADLAEASRFAVGQHPDAFLGDRSSLLGRLGLGVVATEYDDSGAGTWLPMPDELDDEAAPLRRLSHRPVETLAPRIRSWAHRWGVQGPVHDEAVKLESTLLALGLDGEAARQLQTALPPTEPVDAWLEDVHAAFRERSKQVPESVAAWLASRRPVGRPTSESDELRAAVLRVVPLPRGLQGEPNDLVARSTYVRIAPNVGRRSARDFVSGLIRDSMSRETR